MMVKFKSSLSGGRTLYGFVLSERNIELLKEGKPIAINLVEMNGDPKIDIMIGYSKTEESAVIELNQFISNDTIVHADKTTGRKQH